MKHYLLTIGIAMAVLCGVNVALNLAPWYYVIAAVVWCTALQFAFDAVIALTVNHLPDRWFGADNPLFRVRDYEKPLYKNLKVRRWKDNVWELGGLGGFSKKALKEPDNPLYIEKFLIECNRGVVTHRLSYFVGFFAMLTLSGVCVFTVALPVALVNLYLNVLPTLVLRYNTPKLKAVLARLTRNSAPAFKEQDRAPIPQKTNK